MSDGGGSSPLNGSKYQHLFGAIGLFIAFIVAVGGLVAFLYNVTVAPLSAQQAQLRHDFHEELMEKYNENGRRLDQISADIRVFEASVLPRADVDRLIVDLKARIEEMKSSCAERRK